MFGSKLEKSERVRFVARLVSGVRVSVAAVCVTAGGAAAGILLGSVAPGVASASTGRGTLFVGNLTGPIPSITSFGLPASGNVSPLAKAQSKTNSISGPYSMMPDGNGNIWVANWNNSTLVEFSTSQLAANGTPTPKVTLKSPTIIGPVGLALDPKGNLWVACYSTNQLDEFTANQLMASGTIAPAKVITGTHTGLNSPETAVFSSNGDLWVANATTNFNTLVAYTPAALAAGGNQAPAITISPNGSKSLDRPFSLLFDPSGNLWVSNGLGTSLVRFAPSQLAASGNPNPKVTLSSTSTHSLDFPWQMTFDGAGDLWVANSGHTTRKGSIAEFAPSQQRASGTPVPTSIIAGTKTGSTEPAGLVYVPPPPNYLMIGSDGGTFAFGATNFEGSLPGLGVHVNNVVGAVTTPDDKGYLMIGSDGGTFAFGDANFEGSLPGLGVAVKNVVGVVPTPDDKGYLMIASDGGTFAFGDANFEGSLPGLGVHVNNIVGVVPTPDELGYLMIGSDGGTFAFGDANFEGSLPGLGVHVSNIVSVDPSPDDLGYLMIGSDGGTFAFGDVNFEGSLPALGVTVSNIVAVLPTTDGKGYVMIGNDGGTFSFGDGVNVGSLPGLGVHVNNVVTAISG